MLLQIQTAVILLCGFTVSVHSDATNEVNSTVFGSNFNREQIAKLNASIKEEKQKAYAIVNVTRKQFAKLNASIQEEAAKVNAIIAVINENISKLNTDIHKNKPKVGESNMRQRKSCKCLKLTQEDLARYKAKINADKSKVAKIVERMVEPDLFDWREVHPEYVTPVVDQGQCGSCWAFAFAGQLESRYAIQHKTKAEPLSKSELIECSNKYENDACMMGGSFDQAYNYTAQNGLLSEREYPYRNSNGTTYSCKRRELFPLNETLVKPVDFLILGNHQETKNILFQKGPIFVYVNAHLLLNNTDSFDIIRKDDINCCPSLDCPDPENTINHAVLLVGYGVENNVPYWIIKNSWGSKKVGKDGYYRMERGTNTCGIETVAIQVNTN